MKLGRRSITFILVITIVSTWGCTRDDSGVRANQEGEAGRTPAEKETSAAKRVVDFRPGIRIDYRVPQVEIESGVILREAELELFAYAKAPVPKEHETILLLRVKPEHIYQALGLIGLEPGHPVSYDLETQTITEASGDAVDVRVRYEKDSETVEHSASDWMYDLERDAPMQQTHWIFAGSKRDEKGRFAADVEGTVVTVVNFDTALLCLPDLHTDSDRSLWLRARTEVIPPVGTKVTLILRPAQGPTSQKE
ncbi:MAG TPA: YdjY domain-containing protein [Phycisphaerae bacterium]|nr:YdjY domain-containing protein [Phycisphaerae bacterium]